MNGIIVELTTLFVGTAFTPAGGRLRPLSTPRRWDEVSNLTRPVCFGRGYFETLAQWYSGRKMSTMLLYLWARRLGTLVRAF
jgi:hypothetical protein